MTQGGDLGDVPSSPLSCFNCGKELKKRQKRWCSRYCKDKIRLVKFRATQLPAVYRPHKKDKCELCGFVPVHSCQLDVDHIDGNRNNNDLANLQTLCANCHRLKTKLNKDYLKK
jgi:hypothetical protein